MIQGKERKIQDIEKGRKETWQRKKETRVRKGETNMQNNGAFLLLYSITSSLYVNAMMYQPDKLENIVAVCLLSSLLISPSYIEDYYLLQSEVKNSYEMLVGKVISKYL